MIGQCLHLSLELQSAASSEGAEILTFCLLEAWETLSARSRAAARQNVIVSRHRQCIADTHDDPGCARHTPTYVFVTLHSRAFHRDQRDQLASFPTLGTRLQSPLHLKTQGSQRTAHSTVRPRGMLPILSRKYPVRIALKLTSPRNNNLA